MKTLQNDLITSIGESIAFPNITGQCIDIVEEGAGGYYEAPPNIIENYISITAKKEEGASGYYEAPPNVIENYIDIIGDVNCNE